MKMIFFEKNKHNKNKRYLKNNVGSARTPKPKLLGSKVIFC